MARYIDADLLKKYVNGKSSHLLNEWDTLGILSAIDKQPVADVQEVRHGHYVTDWLSDVSCSECGERTINCTQNYCSNCGAKMDRKEDGD